MISPAEILAALPVIVSLVVIEGLLSVDNALAIAALASHLPRPQQRLALKLGLLGAYLFRGLTLAFVSLIIANPWLKILGALYLLYLMASNLAAAGEDDATSAGSRLRPPPGLFLTICQIEFMDLSLSLDNVVAAVALDKRLWVVCTGVFIGILALRFLAGFCLRLIERHPVLECAAFLLIGYVGVLLLAELAFAVHLSALAKFAGIIAIVALTLLYEKNPAARRVLRPVIIIGCPVLTLLDRVIGLLFWPIAKGLRLGQKLFSRNLITIPGADVDQLE